jgi:hypothetical protein
MDHAQTLRERIVSANSASWLPSAADPDLAALLAAFTPMVLRQLVMRMDECSAAADADECTVALRICALSVALKGLPLG